MNLISCPSLPRIGRYLLVGWMYHKYMYLCVTYLVAFQEVTHIKVHYIRIYLGYKFWACT